MLKCFTKRREGNIITLWKVAAEITPSFQNQYTISPCSRSILCEDSEYSILGPRLSWRRLKAGSRCRLGQQVRLNKVPKKYLLHTARNQPVLRPTDKISKHCIFSLQLQWRNLQIHYRSYLSRYPQPDTANTTNPAFRNIK